MMEFINGLSANSILISTVIAIVGYLLKGILWAFTEALKATASKLAETLSTVAVIKEQMVTILQMQSDLQKVKIDLNSAWDEIRKLNQKQI